MKILKNICTMRDLRKTKSQKKMRRMNNRAQIKEELMKINRPF